MPVFGASKTPQHSTQNLTEENILLEIEEEGEACG